VVGFYGAWDAGLRVAGRFRRTACALHFQQALGVAALLLDLVLGADLQVVQARGVGRVFRERPVDRELEPPRVPARLLVQDPVFLPQLPRKRVLLFGEWVGRNVLAPVAHRQFLIWSRVNSSCSLFKQPWFCRRLLRVFVRRGRLPADDARAMRQWQHGGGFSVDGSVRIEATDRAGRERLLRYCARPPFALDRWTRCPKPTAPTFWPRGRRAIVCSANMPSRIATPTASSNTPVAS